MTRKALSRVASISLATTTVLLWLVYDTHAANPDSNNSSNRLNHSKSSRAAFVPVNPKEGPKVNTDSSKLFYADSPDEPERTNKDDNDNNNNMRAWNCHGRNQRDLVDRMMQAKIVRTDSVQEVLNRVDRQHYAPNNAQQQSSPYMDSPQPIGLGQTISAPHMHAHVLEEIYPYLKASKTDSVKILDVGCGSGYLTAALGRWVAPQEQQGSILDSTKTGHVYGIDIYPHLVDMTTRNMQKADQDLLDQDIVSVQVSDGWKGLPEASPFDAIHVGAAAAEFPRALLQQLKVGGVLIIPVGPEGGVQNLYRVERLGDGFTQDDFRITELLGVRYVPLVQQPPPRAD
ncbi:O-methyltransferase [Seminavis robusta]|uniref:protein-L-isoaspartate(D-aspartate) O-methyltransferase n=1 Tax=Seminavis robusta TaxID=568900 RepID=A0A9N8E4W1_9STRA|nr:O-methyltransferase [Seminavis robusta]|eukprot:Sro671_g184840.1 O-methyltransferase (344) ;mRNA; r:15605-16636